MLKNVLSLIFNLIIFGTTAYSVLKFFFAKGDGNMEVERTACFRYFTTDSNILAALTSAVTVVFNVMGLVKGELFVPAWAEALKLVGTAAVTLTLIVVVTMLAPFAEEGYFSLFKGVCFFMHLSTPLLAIVTFSLLEASNRLGYILILPALIPTVIYAVVYFVMVLIKGEKKGGWKDFYGFNKGGRWYVSAPVIIAMTALIAFLLILLHNSAV